MVTVVVVEVRLQVPDCVTVGSQMLTFLRLTLEGVMVMPFKRVREVVATAGSFVLND